jgi:hypothetical protein
MLQRVGSVVISWNQAGARPESVDCRVAISAVAAAESSAAVIAWAAASLP